MDRAALPTALERRQWPAGSNQCHRRLSSLSTPWLSVVGTVDDLRPLPDGENGVPDSANVQPLQRQVDQGTIWTAPLCPPLSSAASGRRVLTNVTDASAAAAPASSTTRKRLRQAIMTFSQSRLLIVMSCVSGVGGMGHAGLAAASALWYNGWFLNLSICVSRFAHRHSSSAADSGIWR